MPKQSNYKIYIQSRETTAVGGHFSRLRLSVCEKIPYTCTASCIRICWDIIKKVEFADGKAYNITIYHTYTSMKCIAAPKSNAKLELILEQDVFSDSSTACLRLDGWRFTTEERIIIRIMCSIPFDAQQVVINQVCLLFVFYIIVIIIIIIICEWIVTIS